MSCVSQSSRANTRVYTSTESSVKIEFIDANIKAVSNQKSIEDGQSAQDTERSQEALSREEAWKRIRLAEACAQCRTHQREQDTKHKHQRLVRIENSAQEVKTIRVEANTTQEIERILIEKYDINSYALGIVFYSSRAGTMHRKQLHGMIDASQEDIYAKLYLKKHPLV